ncbi:uncharacterized protein N7515_004409 [Penicillium bovifimosum]|uniref:Ribonuclease H2 subunit B n=1 Tax=Penicillium bovifimosum TaxID=126998 RepID=A0A9W9H020_9EURO|nr:uncharacterized protein N7515_004409 [Penicillium bovifimosum]KAJ5135131.1 hypothetical protein N7515_004409 [Penicillium bovifimosum]
MKTRSAPASKSAKKSEPEESKVKTLVSAEKPSKTFILPSTASDNARLVSLPDPQSGEVTRYFFCPDRGVYEFTVVAPPTHMARSILFTPRTSATSPSEEDKENPQPSVQGSITKKAELLIATPIDVIFFMIPLLAPSSKSGHSLFQPLDDIIDSHDDMPKHLRQILYDDVFRSSLLARVEAICDVVEAGDENMFRFNETKLTKELVAKAERMADHGLPMSLEERFVRQALATPLMAVKRDDIVISQPSNESEESASKSEDRQDSPSTVATTTTSSVATPVGESTPVPQPPSEEFACSDHITRLLRISTALSFIKESYLSPAMATKINEILPSAESPIDFKPLTDRLEEIAKLRAQALASRDMSNFTRKRNLDDEEDDIRAEKKRRKEEETKSKAAESHAVRSLKKVNTKGMQKMSSFFAKAAPKKT